MGCDPERVRLSRHEATHCVIGMLLGFRVRLVRVGALGGGLVDMTPDYASRSLYLRPDIAPFALFLAASIDDFDAAGYAGPMPTELPLNGGARAALDVIAVLAAGRAIDGVPPESPYSIGSDAHQIRILVDTYPVLRPSVERLQAWLPGFVASMHREIDAVANALLEPSSEATASWLGLEDLECIRADFDEARFQAAARTLNVRLEALAFLVERGWRDAAA